MMKTIPLDEPIVGKEELKYLRETIISGWISSQGPYIKKFEEKYAEYTGTKYAKTCFSGTSALTLTMQMLRLKKGDEIILPSLTFSADAFSITQTGATPVFADCEKEKFTMCPEDTAKKVTKNTVAIMPTHLYGRPADLTKLKELCNHHNILLIEDCCQAQGATYNGKKVGSIGNMGIHSFHNKLLATGEGGMITTNNKKILDRFTMLMLPPPVNNGISHEIRMNHRMSNLHAAVGLAQLERLDKVIAKKQRMAKIYDEELQNIKGINIVRPDANTSTVYWRYTILLDKRISRLKTIRYMQDKKVTVRETYKPLHLCKMYKNGARLPNAEHVAEQGLDLPSSANLTNEQISYVIKQLKAAVKRCAK
jgi:perosamine synthetase